MVNENIKSVFIAEFGPAENLEIREIDPLPPPANNQTLINVKAAALNRADLLQRRGLYPAPKGYPQRVPGLEFSGKVAEAGPNCGRFKQGDRVMGITAGGAQSEQILVDERHAVSIPQAFSYIEAAALPEAFITAHDAVWTQGHLQHNETLLIHAVGSGVGLAALQIAKAKGNRVLGTSRTAQKLDKCRDFGLDLAIDSSCENFAEAVKNAGGVDVILDLVGGKFLDQNLKSLNRHGRLVAVGLVGGRKAEMDLGLVLTKRLILIGTVMRSRSAEEKAEAVAGFEKDVLPLISDGSIRPNVDRVFTMSDVAEAHRYLESNKSFGKVVLEFG